MVVKEEEHSDKEALGVTVPRNSLVFIYITETGCLDSKTHSGGSLTCLFSNGSKIQSMLCFSSMCADLLSVSYSSVSLYR